MRNRITIAAASTVALSLGLALGACTQKKDTAPPGTACTEEAKVCEDGSSVGREGPDCEFAPCPGEAEADPNDALDDAMADGAEPDEAAADGGDGEDADADPEAGDAE